jgi:hypothetical protein
MFSGVETMMNKEVVLVCSDSGNLWQRVNGQVRNPWLESFDRDLVVHFLERLGRDETLEKLNEEIVVCFTPFAGSAMQFGLAPTREPQNLANWAKVAGNTSKRKQAKYWVRYEHT